MKLRAEQIETFRIEGWIFLPEIFDADEVALLRAEAEAIYRQDRSESGAKRVARLAPPLLPTPTASHFACLARTRA